LHALHRNGLLLQMSQVAWSVCLSVCWSHGRCCAKRLKQSRCCLGSWLTWAQDTVLGRGRDHSRGMEKFQGLSRPLTDW